ncbi:unnamed protein product [Absidia cylindrospora]
MIINNGKWCEDIDLEYGSIGRYRQIEKRRSVPEFEWVPLLCVFHLFGDKNIVELFGNLAVNLTTTYSGVYTVRTCTVPYNRIENSKAITDQLLDLTLLVAFEVVYILY